MSKLNFEQQIVYNIIQYNIENEECSTCKVPYIIRIQREAIKTSNTVQIFHCKHNRKNPDAFITHWDEF